MMNRRDLSHRSKGKWKERQRIGLASLAAFSIIGLGIPASAGATSVPPFGFFSSWPSQWSYNSFAVNYALLSNPMFVNLPLAFQLQPSGRWDSQLAKSWKFEGKKLVVTLQPNAKWQNGQRVTSTDVVDTYLLGLAAGWAWGNVAQSIAAPNSHQVVFSLRSVTGTPAVPVTKPMVLSDIFGNARYMVVPSATYGRLITPKFSSEVRSKLTAKPNSPAEVKAATYLGVYDKKITAFDPAHILADGPYEFKSMTTNQMSLVKNPDFYDAGKIHVRDITMWNAGTSSTLGTTELFAGNLDFSWPTLTLGTIKRWKSNPAHHIAYIPTGLGETFLFNDHVYPLNNVKVRQAIYYVVNRADVSISGEGFHANTFSEFPTGLYAGLRHLWLGSNAEMLKEGFQPYNHNPAKARQLLKSAGFTNRKGTWYTSKGKPFTIAITSPAGWASTNLNASNLASQLTAFGIKATATSVEQPGYWTDLTNGNFDMAWSFDGFATLSPLGALGSLLVGYNYVPGTKPGTYTTRGMGFGPNVTVPGIGKVNLAKALTTDEALANKTKIRQLTLDFAKMVNQDVPILQFDTKDSQTYWSTQYYVDWPSLSNKTLWDTAGDTPQETVVLMMEAGFIRPR